MTASLVSTSRADEPATENANGVVPRSARMSLTSCSPCFEYGSMSGTTERYVPLAPECDTNRREMPLRIRVREHRLAAA